MYFNMASNLCAIVEDGTIKIFTNKSLLAGYLDVSGETVRRWAKKHHLKYYNGIMIDFKPDNFNNKNEKDNNHNSTVRK